MLKKMKKYIAVLLTVTLICSFGLTGCGTNSASNSKEATAENPMVLTLAHGLSESHTVHIAMLQFAEEVKQKTNGRIIIKIFPNGQLGSETENLEQLQAGVIAMTKVSAPGLATYNDAYNTFGLPYIFSNIDEFYKIMDSDKMQDFFLSSEDDGFVTLTYFTSGSRSFYTKDKPIRKPEDLKGIKIRVQDMKSQAASKSRTSSLIASAICNIDSFIVISSLGKDQFNIVTGPVSIPFIGLLVNDCAYTDQSTVIGFFLYTSPHITGGLTHLVP